MAGKKKAEEQEQRSLEENFSELEELIEQLEAEDISLEDAFTHAGLTDKAVLVGSLWLIQIVSPETWDLIEAGGNDGFFDVMQRINDTPDGLAGVLKGFAQQ